MKLFDKFFRPNNNMQPTVPTTIMRTEVLEGFAIPGIIKNGQYFFTDLQVYSDGLIYCWEMVDLKIFNEKLNKNWVVTSIPDGEAISIFSLGNWNIEKGEWLHTKETLYKYVYSLIKRLNPNLENLHDYHGSSSKLTGNVKVSKHASPSGRPYYVENPDAIFPERSSGEKIHIFYRYTDDKIYLAQLSIYENGLIEITNIPEKKRFTFDDLTSLVSLGQVMTAPDIGERIFISGLGSFVIKSGTGVNINEKLHELSDKLQAMNGMENSIARCVRIFEEYKANPTRKLKEELKTAYEAVPEHQRIFVGTMDTKDYEVRLIIYGDNEKKRWEERYGFEYPFDDMPKPIDE